MIDTLQDYGIDENAIPLTINEIVPNVIKDLKILNTCIDEDNLNNYQIRLCLLSILYSLEHPENHFSDGSVIFK